VTVLLIAKQSDSKIWFNAQPVRDAHLFWVIVIFSFLIRVGVRGAARLGLRLQWAAGEAMKQAKAVLDVADMTRLLDGGSVILRLQDTELEIEVSQN
jgi:hypothetical protein